MENNILSIDWDFFIPIQEEWCGSYIENYRNSNTIWYKRYFEEKSLGNNITKSVDVAPWTSSFWDEIKERFSINKNVKIYISDSHKLCYNIAKENCCNEIFSFDAHSDLGYCGLSSFKFEINCANWLGRLLNDNIIKKANIIYSPYTFENKKDFHEINHKFNINYIDIEDIEEKIDVSVIHICRSGAWTPPWLDFKFKQFIKNLNLNYKIVDCPKRTWNINNINLASVIEFLYC